MRADRLHLVALRLWMPDRPGVLGQVASRIGAVRGDVVGIEILEREDGVAVDELVVELPPGIPWDLLLREVSQVDGVTVEDIRAVTAVPDPRLDALESAHAILVAPTVGAALDALVHQVARCFEPEWVAVIGEDPVRVWASRGPVPSPAWVLSFVRGARASLRVAAGLAGPDHLAAASFEHDPLSLALARSARPFHVNERRQVAMLARIADLRAHELATRTSLLAHPSAR
jgi:hypothetical protein